MQRFKTWTLTDVHGDVWLDSFAAGNDSLRLATPHDWSVTVIPRSYLLLPADRFGV